MSSTYVFQHGPNGQMIKGRTNHEISVLSTLLQKTITYHTYALTVHVIRIPIYI